MKLTTLTKPVLFLGLRKMFADLQSFSNEGSVGKEGKKNPGHLASFLHLDRTESNKQAEKLLKDPRIPALSHTMDKHTVDTDACDSKLRGVLLQEQKGGNSLLISYELHQLTSAETKMTDTEKCLGVLRRSYCLDHSCDPAASSLATTRRRGIGCWLQPMHWESQKNGGWEYLSLTSEWFTELLLSTKQLPLFPYRERAGSLNEPLPRSACTADRGDWRAKRRENQILSLRPTVYAKHWKNVDSNAEKLQLPTVLEMLDAEVKDRTCAQVARTIEHRKLFAYPWF